MKYKIAICDDSGADRQFVLNMVRAWASSAGHTVHIDDFPSAESFLFRYAEESDYDILLLDIEMGAMDGVTMAKELRKSNDTVQIIFITGYSDYISEGYEVAALHYLLKPVTYERLAQLLDELSSMRPAATDELVIKTSFGYHALRLSDIEYAEARNKHVVFHLRDGRDIEALESFRSVEDRLEQNAVFFKCHRSYQVNLRNIDHFDRTDIIMRSGACIPLSRSCKLCGAL